jgi:hypothetical protein
MKAGFFPAFEAILPSRRVHWIRSARAHVSSGQLIGVSAFAIVLGPMVENTPLRQAFDPPNRAHAGETWHEVTEQVRARWLKPADLMGVDEHDAAANVSFPS